MAKLIDPRELVPNPELSDGETLPHLSEQESANLGESIKKYGVLQPILVSWPDKKIIDGHNRTRWAITHGIHQVSIITNEAHSADEQVEIGIELNAGRRQWTREAREKAVRKRLKKVPHRSDRDLARILCVDHKTVGTYRKEMEATGEIPHYDFRTDKRGSSRKSEGHKGGVVRTNVPTGQGIPRPKTSEAKAPEADATKVGASTGLNGGALLTPEVGAPTGAPVPALETESAAEVSNRQSLASEANSANSAQIDTSAGSVESVDMAGALQERLTSAQGPGLEAPAQPAMPQPSAPLDAPPVGSSADQSVPEVTNPASVGVVGASAMIAERIAALDGLPSFTAEEYRAAAVSLHPSRIEAARAWHRFLGSVLVQADLAAERARKSTTKQEAA